MLYHSTDIAVDLLFEVNYNGLPAHPQHSPIHIHLHIYSSKKKVQEIKAAMKQFVTTVS